VTRSRSRVIVGAAILIVAGLAASVLATRKRSLRMPDHRSDGRDLSADSVDPGAASPDAPVGQGLARRRTGRGATRDYITDGPLVTRARADATDLPVGINILRTGPDAGDWVGGLILFVPWCLGFVVAGVRRRGVAPTSSCLEAAREG